MSDVLNRKNEIEKLLSFILTETESILQSAVSENIKESAMNIRLTAKKIQEIVNSSGKSMKSSEKSFDSVSLNGVIRKALEFFDSDISNGKILIERNLIELPAVYGDFNDLLQVAMNLISNAIEAFRTADAKIIFIETFMDEDSVGFSIEDSGAGISYEQREKIFQRYLSTKNLSEGLGLGLSVCKEIVENAGGRISATDPKKLGGARFEVVFAKKLQSVEIPSTPKSNLRVLVLEDDPEMGRSLYKIFSGKKNKTVICETAKDSISRLRSEKFDLIVADYLLDEMNGLAFLDSMKLVLGDDMPPALIMSGKEREEIEAFGYVFLKKPFFAEELWRAVNKAMEMKLQKGGQ